MRETQWCWFRTIVERVRPVVIADGIAAEGAELGFVIGDTGGGDTGGAISTLSTSINVPPIIFTVNVCCRLPSSPVRDFDVVPVDWLR